MTKKKGKKVTPNGQAEQTERVLYATLLPNRNNFVGLVVMHS